MTVAVSTISSESEISIPPKFITSLLDKGNPLHHHHWGDADDKKMRIILCSATFDPSWQDQANAKVGGLRRGCQGQGDAGVSWRGAPSPVNYDASAASAQSTTTPIFHNRAGRGSPFFRGLGGVGRGEHPCNPPIFPQHQQTNNETNKQT